MFFKKNVVDPLTESGFLKIDKSRLSKEPKIILMEQTKTTCIVSKLKKNQSSKKIIISKWRIILQRFLKMLHKRDCNILLHQRP